MTFNEQLIDELGVHTIEQLYNEVVMLTISGDDNDMYYLTNESKFVNLLELGRSLSEVDAKTFPLHGGRAYIFPFHIIDAYNYLVSTSKIKE